MRKTFYILSVMLLLLCASLYAKSDEVYLRFQPDSFEDLKKLTNVVSIDNIEDGWVYAYANSRELSEFEGYGLPYELLPHPNSLIQVPMTSDKSGMKDWDSYPTYDAYISMMNQFESDYPDLCEIVNVGLSEEGRDILFARISDNVSVEEDEPGVMYTATMHGDELAGYVLTLRLIDYLLSNYGTDSLATRLVDSCEIWINPLANPDGTYAGGNHTVNNSTRYNSNGYDINRNFPDPDGPISNPNGPWQAETVAMMDFAEDYTLAISANIHGGAEVVNYPWDTWSRRHVDDLWYIDISRAYADSAQFYSPSGYLTDLNNGITNGYDWYTTSGNRQDYMNYWHHCREVTLELSGVKKPPASQLPAHWTYNKASFLNWFENALYGIRGVITDASTGLPLYAMVEVINYDEDQDSSQVYTDPEVGDYHRMLKAGTYDLICSAPGYYPDTIFSIAVSQFDAVRHDVQLQPLPNEPILQFAGHNSGPVDPGDTVGFNITLENSGAGISYNTVGTLFTSDPYLTVTQNSSTYPDIGALGGTEISISQYEFAVDLSCPLEYSAPLQLEVTADGGYIDTLTFSVMIGLQIEDFESGDFATFPWEFGGSADWTITASDVYEGSYSAKSGSISDNQSSSLILTADVISSGQISFFYKVSSESGYDYLSFYIDGMLQDEWAGTAGYSEAVYSVSAGLHTFKWEYDKDGSQSSGSDCGWIDFITFPSIEFNPEITTTSLPDWTVGFSYSQQLTATGGMGNMTWQDKNGDLAGTGLTLSSDGLLSGIPVSEGTIGFTALVVDAGGRGSDEKVFSFDINPVVAITTAELPDWTEGRVYNYLLSAEGGTGSLDWSDSNGALSGSGLTLSTSGLISGTPTTADTFTVIVEASDQVGAIDDQTFELVINPAMTITTDQLPDAVVGVQYDYQMEVTGGTGDKSWRDRYNSLDGTGLEVTADGMITGIPLEAGDEGFYAEVEDITGHKVNKAMVLTIGAGYTTGDANDDGNVDVSDAVFIINYAFSGGEPPSPLESGDCNCDGTVDVSDSVYIINYAFGGGPLPGDPDGNGEPDC